MPSLPDERRLRTAAVALRVSAQEATTAEEVRHQIGVIASGLAALQSLDDLGEEGNARAFADQDELWKRMHLLEARLDQLDGKQVTP